MNFNLEKQIYKHKLYTYMSIETKNCKNVQNYLTLNNKNNKNTGKNCKIQISYLNS